MMCIKDLVILLLPFALALNGLSTSPQAVVSAMAAATESIGFGVTVATTCERPYHLARCLSTIDHLSKGRFG
jgi:alkanesulfonate monooxygenase SsuD/methylene tetrahydromethanopterin reductase-like flavin-dependent oxidoreductase (luciferase family)